MIFILLRGPFNVILNQLCTEFFSKRWFSGQNLHNKMSIIRIHMKYTNEKEVPRTTFVSVALTTQDSDVALCIHQLTITRRKGIKMELTISIFSYRFSFNSNHRCAVTIICYVWRLWFSCAYYPMQYYASYRSYRYCYIKLMLYWKYGWLFSGRKP